MMNLWKWLTSATEGPGPVAMALPEPLPPRERTIDERIRAETRPENIPALSRTYGAKLDERAFAEITMRTSAYFGRSGSGMLTQPGGRYISFDPKAIADRIIDPGLVPLVEEFAEAVLALDHEFLAANGDQFKDEKGRIWRREANQ